MRQTETRLKPFDFVHEIATRESNSWYLSQVRDPYGAYYLYYKPGDAIVATECPDGYKLADPRRISPGWTTEKTKIHLIDILRRTPFLPGV
jgi:hypothetical protein